MCCCCCWLGAAMWGVGMGEGDGKKGCGWPGLDKAEREGMSEAKRYVCGGERASLPTCWGGVCSGAGSTRGKHPCTSSGSRARTNSGRRLPTRSQHTHRHIHPSIHIDCTTLRMVCSLTVKTRECLEMRYCAVVHPAGVPVMSIRLPPSEGSISPSDSMSMCAPLSCWTALMLSPRLPMMYLTHPLGTTSFRIVGWFGKLAALPIVLLRT